MPLILYSSDGLVTQVNEQPGLPKHSHHILTCLLIGEIDLPGLAAAYTTGAIVYATPDAIIKFENISATPEPIISPLVDRIGRATVLELLITEQSLSSDDAVALRVIDGIMSTTAFENQAAEIIKLSRSSIKSATELVRRQRGLTAKQAMLLERYNFALRFASADQKEGIEAFLTKRSAKFGNYDSD
jgi:enoyl-CoA hydratase/carnithine racemase